MTKPKAKPPAVKRSAGRPTNYTQRLADDICARIADGASLTSICTDESMPARRTVFDWLERYEDFRTVYARARVFQAEGEVDEMKDIADDARNDWMRANGSDDAGWRANGENVQRTKVRLEQRRWYAEKLLPKKYGAKVAHELTGADGKPIEITEVRRTIVDPKTP